MTAPTFSDPRSTATILNEARKGRAGSNPAALTRLEELDRAYGELDAHHQELIERTQGLGGDETPLVLGPDPVRDAVAGVQEAIRRGAERFREGGVIPGSAKAHYEHTQPIGFADPAAFIKVEGMEEQQSIVEEALELVAGGDPDVDGTPEEALKAVAAMWEGIFPCVINPQQVAAAMMSFAICRESSAPSDRSNFVDMISYALIWAQIEGHSEPPPR